MADPGLAGLVFRFLRKSHTCLPFANSKHSVGLMNPNKEMWVIGGGVNTHTHAKHTETPYGKNEKGNNPRS